MSKELINEISLKLTEIMNLISEEDYVSFIENDEQLHVYDVAADLDDLDNVLTEDFLKVILNKVNEKLNSIK